MIAVNFAPQASVLGCSALGRLCREAYIKSRWFQVSVTGAKSYVAAKQLRSGGRKRTERCTAKVWHLYRDLDTDCDTRLTSLRASEALLPPTAVISISPGTYQIQWRIDCSPFQRQESTLKLLCIAFGRDPVCTNVGRIPCTPGYLSCKYDTTYFITVEYPSDSTLNPDDFRLDIAAANAILLSCSISSQKHSGKHTNPERDWAWILHELAHGKDARKVCQRWLRVAPIYPASLLLRPAESMSQSAKLWLVGGIPMDEVVTLLEVRRPSRFPHYSAPLLGARLRSLRRR